MGDTAENNLTRWRLVLGKYAQGQLGAVPMDSGHARMDRALEFLYSREYRGRGIRQRQKGAGGTLDPSQLTVPKWLNEVRQLFPKGTAETIERHALQRYAMTELVKDPQTLRRLEPNMDLLKTLLSVKGQLKDQVIDEVRRIVRKVAQELTEKLARDVRNAISGKINRMRPSQLKVAQNFDWRGTIRRNLKNYDRNRQRLVIEQALFFSRARRHLPWRIILCVDQSGSMAGSVIYSAVMAGILSSLPAIDVRLVLFDTSVVDMTQYVSDPVEVLMNVQLGGGTNIGQAVQYCEQQIDNPRRTIFTLVSDFEEGASPRYLLAAVRRLCEAGVRLIGLAALDAQAEPSYDRKMAGRLADHGMDVAALTPDRLAQWMASIIQ